MNRLWRFRVVNTKECQGFSRSFTKGWVRTKKTIEFFRKSTCVANRYGKYFYLHNLKKFDGATPHIPCSFAFSRSSLTPFWQTHFTCEI
jgi:hypothetical protein